MQLLMPPSTVTSSHDDTQVKLASKRFLAGSLGLAAGVMLYVSLVEIFVKSQDSFANHGFSEVGTLAVLLSLRFVVKSKLVSTCYM